MVVRWTCETCRVVLEVEVQDQAAPGAVWTAVRRRAKAAVVEEADPSRHEARIVLVLERRVVWAGDQVGRQTELVLLAPDLPENLPRLAADVIDPPRVARGNQELRAVGTHVDRIDMVSVPRLTRSRGSRDNRIAQGDVRGHIPGEDQLPGPQIDFHGFQGLHTPRFSDRRRGSDSP